MSTPSPSSLKIVHVLRAPLGGLFRHVVDLTREQVDRGHQVGLIVDSSTGGARADEILASLAPRLALGVMRAPMHRLPHMTDLSALTRISRRLSDLKPDIVHGHGAKGGAYARLAARALKREGRKLRAFYTPHGGTLNFKPGSLEGRVFLKLEKILEGFSDGIVFESAYAQRVYRERIGPGPAPERIIPNGLQPSDFFTPSQSDSASDVLFVGELRDLKGVDVLLRALARLAPKRPASATIVGAGPDAEKFKAQAAALGLDSLVRFTGALPAREAFELGRIMTVPSRAESFPYIVLEAAAAGLPLIATSVGGIPEIVAGTDTALIAPGDDAVLAEAIAAALDDPDAARARAARLKANVHDKFNVAGMAGAVLAFYALRHP